MRPSHVSAGAGVAGWRSVHFEAWLACRVTFATLDSRGNLYLTGRGVTVYNPAGGKLGTIPVPSKWVGNVCFGGKDRQTLFITASESVYTLLMQVAGVE